jgi:Xaa-Pro dipeptidase
MTIGVGGSTAEEELARLQSLRGGAVPIGDDERRARIAKGQALMRAEGIQALYLDASTNALYFTGVRFKSSERLHGIVIPADGEIVYVSPAFEAEKLQTMISLAGKVRCWEEHESPTELVPEVVRELGYASGVIAIDPATPFSRFDGFRRAGNAYDFVNGGVITDACRRVKSAAEIALIRQAMELSLVVQKATARILREGITTTEVADFIARAHLKLGTDGPPNVSIVLFGEPTAYPHGVPYAQTLQRGDMVLVDIGATVHGYQSDLTRSYVFGEPSARQREIWNLEKQATEAAFAAAQIGAPCETVDAAARRVIEAAGLGPGYATPGLPHRAGHGIGLDIHEEPYIVPGDKTLLSSGMCFSNEPTICIYGEFGVRLEDHIYMDEHGPRWFTPPAHSVADPFGYHAAGATIG